MTTLKGKRILILQQRGWSRAIGRFLARKLAGEGCSLATITFQPAAHEFIINQKEVKYEMIISNDEGIDNPLTYLAGDNFSLKEICAELGVDSIWPMVYALRHFVKSYKDKYYFSFKKSKSDEEIIDYVKATYKYIRLIFEKFKPDIVIAANFVSLPHIMINLYGLKHNVPMFGVMNSMTSGYYIFVNDYLGSRGDFHNRIDELNLQSKESPNQQKAKKYIGEFRENFKQPNQGTYYTPENKSWIEKLKHELLPYREILMWYLKKRTNFVKNIGISIDYRPPRIVLRDHYCEKHYRKYMENLDYYPLEKLGKFVYFPLQFQPETVIDTVSPYFSNQIETARLVAMSLPDDYTLVVKEHPAMIGVRAPSYIEKLVRTVNVKMIDYRIPSETILRKTDLVVNAGGTILSEAAMYKKPVIQLGNMGTTLKLPNVFKHTDLTTLTKKIKEVLAIDLNTEEYERKLENYVTAAFDTGFGFNYVAAWERGKGDMEELWRIYKKELEKNFLNKCF